MMKGQQNFIDKFWYQKHPLSVLLSPFAMIFQGITLIRRKILERFFQKIFDVPIIVVGNITVGGVGKTPLVVELAKALQARGLRVGIVSRGYGARIRIFPYAVSLKDDAEKVGDEPLLLRQKALCPVVIAPKRVDAIQYLLKHHQPEIIISDDGLQHYAMGRAIEMIVVDGQRGMGNGFCLPAGPLREGTHRLKQADFLVVNGAYNLDHAYRMDLLPSDCVHLKSGRTVSLESLPYPFAAVAGIGNPNRFFELLRKLGVVFHAYPFADHHVFQKEELCFKEQVIMMTEKDAVKCRSFATDSMYYLPVNANLCPTFWDAFWSHKHLQGLV